MARENAPAALRRILNAASRQHLYEPFRTSSKLRAAHFPGAGREIQRARLVEAYAKEFEAPAPNWELISHGTWPWIKGHAHDLAFLADDLARTAGSDPSHVSQDQLAARFTQAGAEEIAVFLEVFSRGSQAYRKAVLKALAQARPSQEGPMIRDAAPADTAPPPTAPLPPVQPGLTPQDRARYALLGSLVFAVPALLGVAIQFWRRPQENHWVALCVAGLFGLVVLACLIDFLLKRHR